MRFNGDQAKADAVYAGFEPLTPEDIAEHIVYCAGRRENVVIADSLIFPNQQVSIGPNGKDCSDFGIGWITTCYPQEVKNVYLDRINKYHGS